MRQLIKDTHLPWPLISRLILIAGMAVPGLILTLTNSGWTTAGSLGAVDAVMPIWAFGIVMLIGAALMVPYKLREYGYVAGGIAWGTLGLGYIGTLVAGTAISPLGIAYLLITLLYYWAASTQVDNRLLSDLDPLPKKRLNE